MDHYPLRDGMVHCEDVPLPLIAGAVAACAREQGITR